MISNSKQIARKNKELKNVEDTILHLGDLVKQKSKEIAKAKEDGVSERIAKSRHVTHQRSVVNDISLRCSDREQSIRTYSKMDLDVWSAESID